MIDPIKRIRQTLFSIHPISYRIRRTKLDTNTMNRTLFIKVIAALKKIEERRDFMAEEIGMDMTAYEDSFFDVIENLMKMTFKKAQLGLIQMYLYQLLPDKEWDGTITLTKNKEDKVFNFKTPAEVWDVITKLEE